MPNTTKRKRTVDTASLLAAQSYVGKRAILTSGIVRGIVTVKATRPAYGRIEVLLENDLGEHRWISINNKHLKWQQ